MTEAVTIQRCRYHDKVGAAPPGESRKNTSSSISKGVTLTKTTPKPLPPLKLRLRGKNTPWIYLSQLVQTATNRPGVVRGNVAFCCRFTTARHVAFAATLQGNLSQFESSWIFSSKKRGPHRIPHHPFLECHRKKNPGRRTLGGVVQQALRRPGPK